MERVGIVYALHAVHICPCFYCIVANGGGVVRGNNRVDVNVGRVGLEDERCEPGNKKRGVQGEEGSKEERSKS
jgi:hypothetical protein